MTATLGTAFASDSVISQNDGYPVLNSSLYGTAATALQADANGVYNIYTAQELRSIAYMVNVLGKHLSGKTVKLQADIDLENQEWIPIGGNTIDESSTMPVFKGTFDGNGHIITNMRITSGNRYVGLIGYASGATIKNVGIENSMVIGREKVAALAGSVRGASKITDCYSKANVSGTTAIGSIVGMIGGSGSSVLGCYNTGEVMATNQVAAGIAGYLASDATKTKIQNCYNIGTGSAGIVGKCNTALTDAEILNCYTIDTVELAFQPNSMVVTDCAKVTAKTLRTYAATLGSAYAEDYLAQNTIFPVLAWQNGDAATKLSADKNGVYLVNNADELRLLSYLVRTGTTFKGKKVLLTADIDLGERPWYPIGGSGATFHGTFDGGGHVISNIYASYIDSKFIGLFGIVNTGVIKNVGIESGCFIGKEHVGGIIGNMGGGANLKNCYNKATVYATTYAGGLIGMINTDNVAVQNCYNKGDVYAKESINRASGLVGYIASNTEGVMIENCYDIGNYNAAFGQINSTATGTVIRNTYSVGGVRMAASGAYSLESGTALATSAIMKTYSPVLGSAFVYDEDFINDGYPVLSWEILLGDVDDDGSVTIKDVLCLVQALLDNEDVDNGDMNSDGGISLIDVVLIVKLIAE